MAWDFNDPTFTLTFGLAVVMLLMAITLIIVLRKKKMWIFKSKGFRSFAKQDESSPSEVRKNDELEDEIRNVVEKASKRAEMSGIPADITHVNWSDDENSNGKYATVTMTVQKEFLKSFHRGDIVFIRTAEEIPDAVAEPEESIQPEVAKPVKVKPVQSARTAEMDKELAALEELKKTLPKKKAARPKASKPKIAKKVKKNGTPAPRRKR